MVRILSKVIILTAPQPIRSSSQIEIQIICRPYDTTLSQ